MRLGRAGGAADAVTSGTPAEQDDLVARSRGFAAHMICRSRGHNRTNLHTLGHISGMVDLVHLTGGKTDLVAVGGITGGGGSDELALGSLPSSVSDTGTVGSAAPVTRMAWYT